MVPLTMLFSSGFRRQRGLVGRFHRRLILRQHGRRDAGQGAGRVQFAAKFVEDRALDRADAAALGIHVVADALGAFFRVDQEMRAGLVDRLIGAERLAGITVDAGFDDFEGHAKFSLISAVIPAQAGIQMLALGSRLRGNDEDGFHHAAFC